MDKQPIYIVTGYMRSGTSMMMQCLVKGGLDPVIDSRRELMNQNHGDQYYQPNKHGFYEPSMTAMQDLNFPTMHEGRVLKILRPGVAIMRPYDGGYRVVCMKRDREEIRQSYEAFFGYELKNEPYFNQYELFIEWVHLHLENRRDILSYHVLEYPDVVANPYDHFLALYQSGWPINPVQAASAVDPSQYRFRLENLVTGMGL